MRTAAFGSEKLTIEDRDKARKLHFRAGDRVVIRMMTDPVIYRKHKDAIRFTTKAFQGKEAKAYSLPINCRKAWSDEANDYVGECESCDRGDKFEEHITVGVVILGEMRGRAPQEALRVDPAAGSVRAWSFMSVGADGRQSGKLRRLNELAAKVSPKKLTEVNLLVVTGGSKDDEKYQKCTIDVYTGSETVDYDSFAKEWVADDGAGLVARVSAPPSKQKMQQDLQRDEGAHEKPPEPKKDPVSHFKDQAKDVFSRPLQQSKQSQVADSETEIDNLVAEFIREDE